jgi:hypothetical protein
VILAYNSDNQFDSATFVSNSKTIVPIPVPQGSSTPGNLTQMTGTVTGLPYGSPTTFHVFPVNATMNTDSIVAGCETTYAYGTQTATPTAQVTVSVPVKMIWAAMKSDGGNIVSPTYQMENNGTTRVQVSLTSYTITQTGERQLNFTDMPTNGNDISLSMSGTVPTDGQKDPEADSSPFGLSGYCLNNTDGIGTPLSSAKTLGTLNPSGSVGDTATYRWTGTYGNGNGNFSTPAYPQFSMTFSFKAVP